MVPIGNIKATKKSKTEFKRKFPEFFHKVLGHVQTQNGNLKLKKMQHQYSDRKVLRF